MEPSFFVYVGSLSRDIGGFLRPESSAGGLFYLGQKGKENKRMPGYGRIP